MSYYRQMKGALFSFLVLSSSVCAQDFSALARLDPAQSGAIDSRRSVAIELFVSQPVPYRVFTLDEPRRLVMDFKEVEFRGVDPLSFTESEWIDDARFGGLRPGWSRMILELSAPASVDAAGMRVDPVDGSARITIELSSIDTDVFSQGAGLPDDPQWAFELAEAGPAVADTDAGGPLVVVIDPGHGGIDPGATIDGIHEADVMLALALELSNALGRFDGIQPEITRRDDTFVPLQERMSIARRSGADLLISLHADALEGEQATGASIYTLTQEASDVASQRMAERHDQSDLLAGIDLTGQADEVALVLQDLVRVETSAASNRFADQLVQAMRDTNTVMNTRPRRSSPLAVLNSADFPSVLIETGFLSNPNDRVRLTTPEGRAPIVAAVTLAVGRWVIEEAALSPLIRQ